MSWIDSDCIAGLPELGPKSADRRRRARIAPVGRLRALGSVEATRRTRQADAGASLNLLWAREGALTGCIWREMAGTARLRLLIAPQDVERSRGRGRRA